MRRASSTPCWHEFRALTFVSLSTTRLGYSRLSLRCRSCTALRRVRGWSPSRAFVSGRSLGNTGRTRERRQLKNDGCVRRSWLVQRPPQSSRSPRSEHPMRFCSSSLPMRRALRNGGGCHAPSAGIVEGYHLQVWPRENVGQLLADGFEDVHSRLFLNAWEGPASFGGTGKAEDAKAGAERNYPSVEPKENRGRKKRMSKVKNGS